MRWLVALALTGCFRPSPPEGQACGPAPERWCPPPLRCASDGTCRSTDMPPDASDTDPDGPLPDADLSRTNLAFVAATPLLPKTLGPPAMADARCNQIAHGAGHLGTFVAWISTPASPAPARLGSARGWVRYDGRPFVDKLADLASGRIYYPLRLDENGAERVVIVQTGTTDEGVGTENCVDYTSQSTNDLMLIGTSDATTRRWTNNSESTCDLTFSFYCLQIDHNSPLPPPAEPGPKAFLSNVDFVADTGLAAADSLCQTEAVARGLSGTFLALLSTTTASALSRVGGVGVRPWVRLDGAATSRNFVAWDAPITLTAAGDYTDQQVWSGASSPALASASVADSCNDWSAGGNGGRFGQSSRAGPEGFGASVGPCNGPRRIYCLEKR